MADRSKVSWAKLKVGLLAIAALIIVGFLIFLMAGSNGLFASKVELVTFFSDANGLAEGSPVTLNGVSIDGKIQKVENVPSGDPERSVRITMEVGEKFLNQIPTDSRTEMASANLLGTYYINIKRGKNPQTVQAGAELASTQTAEMADLFRQSSQTLGTLSSVVDKINAIVADIQAGKGSIGELLVDDTLVKNFVEIEDQFKQLTADVHNTINSSDNSLGKLLHDNGAIYDDVHNGIASLDKSLDGINKVVEGVNNGEGTLGQFVKNPAMYDDSRKLLADMHSLLADLQSGKGTAGKLIETDELGNEIKTTMGKVDALLDKMNNGQGTMARLLNDPSLFEDLDGLTRESHALIKDFRANPKKFLRIKLSLF